MTTTEGANFEGVTGKIARALDLLKSCRAALTESMRRFEDGHAGIELTDAMARQKAMLLVILQDHLLHSLTRSPEPSRTPAPLPTGCFELQVVIEHCSDVADRAWSKPCQPVCRERLQLADALLGQLIEEIELGKQKPNRVQALRLRKHRTKSWSTSAGLVSAPATPAFVSTCSPPG